MTSPTVTLIFMGNEKDLLDSINRTVSATNNLGDTTEKATGKMSSSWNTMKGVLGAGIVQKGISELTGFFKGMNDEARESEKVSASTAQGIKTMGAESWTSADAIANLSSKMSEKIGVDDEAIQQSANLLLTFGNVKNATGDMNNVFDRAVAATQDLAAKGFGDADSSAKMLGKALNDPIKGLTALGKAGVTFSDAQKMQIKDMVRSGDLLGAQKLLMAEVEKQVGGTAAATATAGDKMAVTWANFQEQLGTLLMPIIDKALTKLQGFIEWAQEHPQIVIAIAAVTAGIWLLNMALNANPIVLVTTLIAALVAGLVILWTQSAGFRDFFIGAWGHIRDFVTGAVGGVVNAFKAIVEFVESIPKRVGDAFAAIGRGIADGFKAALNVAIDVINWFVDRANSIIHGINIISPFSDIPPIPHIARLQTGGRALKDGLAFLHEGETVRSRGESDGASGAMRLVAAPGADSAVGNFINTLIRRKWITLEPA